MPKLPRKPEKIWLNEPRRLSSNAPEQPIIATEPVPLVVSLLSKEEHATVESPKLLPVLPNKPNKTPSLPAPTQPEEEEEIVLTEIALPRDSIYLPATILSEVSNSVPPALPVKPKPDAEIVLVYV